MCIVKSREGSAYEMKAEMTGDRTKRKSDIELLRIVAAFGVIILHYNNPSIGGGYKAVADGSVNQFIMTIFEAAFICAVNLYVLISGYFMKASTKRDLLKPVKLIAQFAVIELLFYLIKEVPKAEGFSLAVFMRYFTPSYWFVFVYIALYLISPYVNLVWNRLEDKGKRRLLYIVLGLFSVYPILCEVLTKLSEAGIWGADMVGVYGLSQGVSTIGLFGSGAGYTIVNFVIMYLIGCFIKEKEEVLADIKNSRLVVLLAANVAAILAWTYAEKALTGNALCTTTGWNYENPLVITEAVLFFLLFTNMPIKHGKAINRLAAASFPSYLIHMNLLEYIHIEIFVKANPFFLILHMIGSTMAIYLMSFVINELYEDAAGPIFKAISKRWRNRFYTVP